MKASYKISYWQGKSVCSFFVDGRYNLDVKGSNGTGVKHYDTHMQAKAAGRRYLKRMKQLGFKVEG